MDEALQVLLGVAVILAVLLTAVVYINQVTTEAKIQAIQAGADPLEINCLLNK
jgi:hypothetical protein